MNRKKVLKEFLSETDEVHALWFGFYHSWRLRGRVKLPEESLEEIRREYHYYTLGFFLGRVAQAVLALYGITLIL